MANKNPAPQKKCPECGQSVHVRTLVCPHCGHKFARSGEKAPAAAPAKQEGVTMPVISRDRWKDYLSTEKEQLEEQRKRIDERMKAIDTLISAG